MLCELCNGREAKDDLKVVVKLKEKQIYKTQIKKGGVARVCQECFDGYIAKHKRLKIL